MKQLKTYKKNTETWKISYKHHNLIWKSDKIFNEITKNMQEKYWNMKNIFQTSWFNVKFTQDDHWNNLKHTRKILKHEKYLTTSIIITLHPSLETLNQEKTYKFFYVIWKIAQEPDCHN